MSKLKEHLETLGFNKSLKSIKVEDSENTAGFECFVREDCIVRYKTIQSERNGEKVEIALHLNELTLGTADKQLKFNGVVYRYGDHSVNNELALVEYWVVINKAGEFMGQYTGLDGPWSMSDTLVEFVKETISKYKIIMDAFLKSEPDCKIQV